MSSKSRDATLLSALVLGCVLFSAGCAPSSQGIKVRAQGPAIEEAFRRLSLAISVDGYPVERADPATFNLESGWKALTKVECGADTAGVDAVQEGRITLKMARRGALYDVILTPWVRTQTQGSGTIAPPTHPLRIKWETVITRLIEREARDED